MMYCFFIVGNGIISEYESITLRKASTRYVLHTVLPWWTIVSRVQIGQRSWNKQTK